MAKKYLIVKIAAIGDVIMALPMVKEIRKKDEDHFIAHITVALSRPFFGWMFSVGDGLKIIAPESVVCRMKEELDRVRNLYENGKEDQE